MNYKAVAEYFRGKDIIKLMTEYPVDVEKLSEEHIECFDAEGIDTIWLSGQEIEDMEIPYDAVDWYFGEEIEEPLELMQKAPHYLVYASGCRWDGSSGYKFCENVRDCFERDYDVSLIFNGVLPNGKAMLLTEYSHDVPTGSSTVIVALSEKEQIRLANKDFYAIRDFALEYLEKITMSQDAA